MTWLIENLNTAELLILSLFPILGLIFQRYLTKHVIKLIIYAAIICLLPLLMGYDFVLSWFYELCVTILLGGLFSFYLKKIEKKSTRKVTTIVMAIIIFIVFVVIAFFDTIMGYDLTEKKWTKNGYKVEYVVSRGFSKGPSFKYELYHSPLFGLFNKKIQTITSRSNQFDNCVLIFDKAQVKFDKCKGEIIQTP